MFYAALYFMYLRLYLRCKQQDVALYFMYLRLRCKQQDV